MARSEQYGDDIFSYGVSIRSADGSPRAEGETSGAVWRSSEGAPARGASYAYGGGPLPRGNFSQYNREMNGEQGKEERKKITQDHADAFSYATGAFGEERQEKPAASRERSGQSVSYAVPVAAARFLALALARSLSMLLDALMRVKPLYWLCAAALVGGYAAGTYYWNASDYSFLYPKRAGLLRHADITDSVRGSASMDSANRKLPKASADNAAQFRAVSTTEYTLKAGDTLLGIAIANGLSIDTVISWNKITDARRIREGQRISIPDKDGLLHAVKNNESISGIAGRYSVSVNQILDANNLSSSVLTPGMNLFIPGAKMDSFDRALVLGTVFLNPLSGRMRLTSPYGYRISPITGKRMFHNGIDLAQPFGSPIVAAGSGVVTYAESNNPAFGMVIIIRHARGFQTLYGHLSSILVRRGERVERGQIVGRVGNTGLSTGPHLHFTIIQNGSSVNPLNYIRL